MQKTIDIRKGVTRMTEWRMRQPVDFTALNGEHIVITGHNGAGKTMLTNIITGSHPLIGNGVAYDFAPSTSTLVADNIKYISFRDAYGEAAGNYYLQQRWNQAEIDSETPLTRDVLADAATLVHSAPERLRQLCEMFEMTPLMDKPVILLSSGELRKLQLIKALLPHPRILIIDNPFIGLDADARALLDTLLSRLAKESDLQIILVMSRTDDMPDFITHVVEVKDMTVLPKATAHEYMSRAMHVDERLADDKRKAVLSLPYKHSGYDCRDVIRMDGVTIRYGDRVILDKLYWTVNNDERWALSGRNGSGKSTLLSLVCADNPQGYACDISLFGRRRGSGESIWDIKKRIGYVSPEMHRAYRRNLPAIQIVASGLKDSVGLYATPNDEEYETCKWWMDIFGLRGMEDRPFLKLSSGEQRLVLLARAFVKDPDLLILDEPLHGLDRRNMAIVKDIIDTFCQRKNKTLIMVSHYAEELPSCINRHLNIERHY